MPASNAFVSSRRRAACAALLTLACALPAFAASAATTEIGCLIEPNVTVKLAPSVSGLLDSVPVGRGDLVGRGDVLARLESRVEEANVALARTRAANDFQVRSRHARADFLTRKRARTSTLQTGNVASAAALDEVDADLRMAQSELGEAVLTVALNRMELERAEALLQQRIIRAPFAGVVVERVLSQGEFVHDQAHVMTLAQLDPLKVEAFLPLAMLREVKVGARLMLRPESPVGGRHEATVTTVDRVADSRSGTFGVQLRLANPDLALPGGIRCVLEVGG